MQEHIVLMAGPRSAGKTVFLSAMHKHLSQQRDGVDFFLSADLGDASILRSTFASLSTNRRWPKANALEDFHAWRFHVRVQSAGLERFGACNFEYYDYSGGLLEGQGQDTPESKAAYDKLIEVIDRADAILGMLDGEKLLAFITSGKSHPVAEEFIKLDLPLILEVMLFPSRKVALHFVVSKWDLFQNREITLKQVHDCLMRVDDFRRFVSDQRGHTIRLIPVSAVGQHFAKPDKAGVMQIQHDVDPEPYQPVDDVGVVIMLA